MNLIEFGKIVNEKRDSRVIATLTCRNQRILLIDQEGRTYNKVLFANAIVMDDGSANGFLWLSGQGKIDTVNFDSGQPSTARDQFDYDMAGSLMTHHDEGRITIGWGNARVLRISSQNMRHDIISWELDIAGKTMNFESTGDLWTQGRE